MRLVQLVEHQIVVLVVVGSSPTSHPKARRGPNGLVFCFGCRAASSSSPVLSGALPLTYPAAPGLCPTDRPPPFALKRSSFVPDYAAISEQTLQIETFVPVSGLFSEQNSIGIIILPCLHTSSPNSSMVALRLYVWQSTTYPKQVGKISRPVSGKHCMSAY